MHTKIQDRNNEDYTVRTIKEPQWAEGWQSARERTGQLDNRRADLTWTSQWPLAWEGGLGLLDIRTRGPAGDVITTWIMGRKAQTNKGGSRE
jgi:hypothetical protein